MIYWFFLLGNSAFGNGLNGHTGVELCLCTVSLCLLVRRQLDRLYSIASQCSLTLKVTGTLNELVINIFTNFFQLCILHCYSAAKQVPDLCSHETDRAHRNCRSASLFARFSWPTPSVSSFSHDATKRSPKHAERCHTSQRAIAQTAKARRSGNAFRYQARLVKRGVLGRENVTLCWSPS